MACVTGTNIVNTGIVLNLDSSNRKSRGQSRHINQIPDGDMSNGSIYNAYLGGTEIREIVQVSDVPRTNGTLRNVLQITSATTRGGGGNFGGFSIPNMNTLIPGKTYEMSFYARSMTGSNLNLTISHQNGSGDNSNLPFYPTMTPTWQKFSRTFTLNIRKNIIFFWVNVASSTFQIADLIIKETKYNVDFVDDYSTTNLNSFYNLKNNSKISLINGVNFTYENNIDILTFDGVNDYCSNLNDTVDVSQDYSISLWFKPTVLPQLGGIISIGTDYDTDVIEIGIGNIHMTESSNYMFVREYGATATRRHTITPNITTNWNFMTFVSSGQNFKSYLNGTLIQTESTTKPSFTGPILKPFYLGMSRLNTSPWKFFNGSISKTTIYSRTLSEIEIKQNFEATRSRYGI